MAIESIEIRGITKRYGRHRALAGVDLSLERGRLCTLLGHNGAGKSTLLGLLSTLVRPTSGSIAYRAGDISLEPSAGLRQRMGVLAHEPFVYGQLTAVENLRFWGQLYSLDALDRRVAELLDRVGLEGRARSRPVHTYSRGMIQRLALARALLHDPELLLLDEPFTGLDRRGAAALRETLAGAVGSGKIVVVVTHDLEAVAPHTGHVVVLKRGKIAADETRDSGSFEYGELAELYHRFSE